MKRMRYPFFRIYSWLIWMIGATVACSDSPEASPPAQYPVADGTFIQDQLVAQWDDEQWQKELAGLKELGMHYLVFAPTLHTDEEGQNRMLYPGTLPNASMKYQADLVENCLRNAKEAGLKVFLGLNFNEKWWSANFSEEWLFGQMELGNQLADDLTNLYKDRYRDTMYGWYWVWEVDNLNCTTTERQEILARAINMNIDHLNQITPDMPFMLCPFVNYRVGNSDANREMWQYVFSKTHFRKGDIFAPQDCVGAGGLELDMVDEWFGDMNEAVKTKPELLFWSDAETFDHRFWTSAPIDRFVKQMEAVKPYVSNIITFAYGHYYSPSQVTQGFHNTYFEYVRTGSLPKEAAPEPVSGLFISPLSGGGLELHWKEPANRENLAGYYIYRNGELIGNLQYKSERQMIDDFQDKNTEAGKNYQYLVCSYKCSGLVSSPTGIEWSNN